MSYNDEGRIGDLHWGACDKCKHLAEDTSCAKYGKNDPDMTVNFFGDYIICEGFEAKS